MLNPNVNPSHSAAALDAALSTQPRRWAVAAFSAAALFIGLSLPACGGSDEIVDSNDPTCLNCTASCKANSECAALLECADDCSDDDCRTECEEEHPAGKAMYDTAKECMADSCS